MTGVLLTLREFFSKSFATGILLLISCAAAIVLTNSPLHTFYEALKHADIGSVFSYIPWPITTEHIVNDGLMVIFFLAVGLEIKRELIGGELSKLKQAMLPVVAAVFGMIVPGLIYTICNIGTPTIRGWAIPVATDIAFALGVLALLGSRIPLGLKVFLSALAIIDDLLSIVIIAIFYTDTLNYVALSGVAIVLISLIMCNRFRVRRLWIYGVLGIALWACMMASGVHATVAGVLLAMTIPLSKNNEPSLLHRLEHLLHKPVSFVILPIFAFINGGVVLQSTIVTSLTSAVGTGIIAGMFIGKQIGVFLSSVIMVRSGIAALPAGVSFRQLYGVSLLCGIGFTMSMFVSHLAFTHPTDLSQAQLAILVGSLVSGVAGTVVLAKSGSRIQNTTHN